MIAGLYDIFAHWHKQGTVWIYSDTHFNDKELGEGVAARPSAEEHLKLINSKVGKKDTFIHLGDVGDIEFIRKIKGYKVLIAGNHDAGLSNYKRIVHDFKLDAETYSKEQALDYAKKLYPNCKYIIEKGYQFSFPFEFWQIYADNGLFDEVYGGPVMIAEKLILSHEPVDCPWAFNIHGHVHSGGPMSDERHLNVCGEARGCYEPINFNQFMKAGFMAKIQTIHRDTIDKATKRARKREKRNGK
jgi:calcineurin-like phosphoesterase family protein